MFRGSTGLLALTLIAASAASASAAIAIDVAVFKDQTTRSATTTTPTFSTASGNELLLAFIATDQQTGSSITVQSVTGGGLTWALVRRTNVQRGTSEIWRAFGPSVLTNAAVTATLSQSVVWSMTVMSFSGVDASGTNGSGAIGATGSANAGSGAPSATLVTTRDGSWVLGVGNDYDNATARVLGAGQVMVHQYLAAIGDTYWVQRRSMVTPLSGTSVAINDTAPTGDRYNLTIVEVLAPAGGGTPTFSVSGTISPAAGGSGAIVTLTQGATTIGTTTADSAGNYAFANVANGTYTVTPAKTAFTFAPASQSVVVNGANAQVPAFTATQIAWRISGTITPAADGSGSVVTLTQNSSTIATTTASGSGNYTFSNVANGQYLVTPSKSGFAFSPAQQTVTVNGADVGAINFTAQTAPTPLLYPNLSVILPTGGVSITVVGGHRMLDYTHDTFNGGPGPLVIQPAYNPASGAYQGTQYIYRLTNGTWSIGATQPVAGAFVFHAEHGHFHFPLATYGLYAVGPDGGPGAAVALSGKIGFCINDSFLYDPTLPNAGAIGNLGPCTDPTSLRGINIGAVDEYDRTDDGQSINIDAVPDGTYWLRALVDPNNFLADANKADSETELKLTITGNTVQALDTVVPALADPPAITLTSPSGTIFSTVSMTATTATASSVQMLVDGQPLGSPISTAPYTLAWDTTGVPDGVHWLAAQTTGPTGVIGTSPVVAVTVANGGTAPPSVQITGPADGSTVSSTVTLYAQAASGTGIADVTFFVDGTQIGQPVTAPPFLTNWDTRTSSDGAHVLTATARDTAGLTTTSTAVNVTVDNAHPPATIVKEATVSVDSSGTMTTPVFSTATAGDLLVAFVSYDGPQATPQTATVTGAGLTWTLAIRSNTQHGTAEIWTARAAGTLVNATVQSVPGTGSYHGSMTVIAFKNAAAIGVVGRTGAPSGAPDIGLPGISAGNWVFAAGNDWDGAVARTPVAGQVLVHQRVDTSTGDTFWVQSTTAPSTANALVDIHDSAPTTDQWNYAAVEIVATRQ